MQDFDLYTGKNRYYQRPPLETVDPDYFTRMAAASQKEEVHRTHRASRILAVVSALCIISFTVGLVTGIKFAGGEEKEIVDPATKQAMSQLGEKVSDIVARQENAPAEENAARPKTATDPQAMYPREEYPFVVRIGEELENQPARELAGFLSGKGHTVVMSRSGANFRLYVGPFKQETEAESALQKIREYTFKQNRLGDNVQIIKR